MTKKPVRSAIPNTLEIANYIGDLLATIEAKGIHLEMRTDFGYLVRLCEELPSKGYPTAMFNPLHHQIGPENGFWLLGTNDAGEVVHTQAVRYDDFTGTNLAEEFENLGAFYFDPEVSAQPGEWCESFAPEAREITGPTCYHGELWLKPGEQGMRGKGLSAPLARLAMALASLQFQPEFFYGITYKDVILKGVATLYGYWHIQPRAVYWERPNRDEPLDVWLVWLTGKDILRLIAADRAALAGALGRVPLDPNHNVLTFASKPLAILPNG